MNITQKVLLFFFSSIAFTMDPPFIPSEPSSHFLSSEQYFEEGLGLVEAFNEPTNPMVLRLEAAAECFFPLEQKKAAERVEFEKLFSARIYGPLYILAYLWSEKAIESPKEASKHLRNVLNRQAVLFRQTPYYLLHGLMLKINEFLLPNKLKANLYHLIFQYHPGFREKFLHCHVIKSGGIYMKFH